MDRHLAIADDHLERILSGEEILLQDGAMGTQLQAMGAVPPGRLPDVACLASPDAVTAVHRRYVEAGAEMVTTNTFGSTARRLAGAASVEDVCHAAVACARAAGARYVAGSMGPVGELLDPYGDLEPEEAVELYAEQARALAAAGADVIAVETMSDLTEATCALKAACRETDLPVFASMTYGEHGRTMFGVAPADAARALAAAGASVIGVNCSLGPEGMLPIVAELVAHAPCPVAARPNAGLPALEGGRAVYPVGPDEFARAMGLLLDAGATVVGGCCGTAPEHIAALAAVLRARG